MCDRLSRTRWNPSALCLFYFFFKDTATTEIYTLSLHDALPISPRRWTPTGPVRCWTGRRRTAGTNRSEEHTSELQSLTNLVCRLLLEKKKQQWRRTRPAPKEKRRGRR